MIIDAAIGFTAPLRDNKAPRASVSRLLLIVGE